jgi:hypothetical protein
VQANTVLEGDKVVLKEYEPTLEGMVQSFAERDARGLASAGVLSCCGILDYSGLDRIRLAWLAYRCAMGHGGFRQSEVGTETS